MTALSKQDVNASLLDLRTRKALLDMIEVVTVAAAGSSETDATSLTGTTNVVTASDGAKGVILPRSKRDTSVRVINSVAGSALLVYPDTGGQINALTATTGAFTVPGSNEATFVCDADLHWYVAGGGTEAFDNLSMTNPINYDHNTTITAFAGGGQASATALTGEFNNVTTCATAGDSVKLMAAAAGLKITVKNSGATSLAVFPATDDSINALAANLSVNIPVGGELTFRTISATVWETNEAFVSPAPTTQRGEFVFKASDNAADHEVILTNASHGQATTTTIPDPAGATGTIVLEEIANAFDLPQKFDHNTTITAFATGGQASATALTGQYNNVTTCATANDSVKLPAAALGQDITVKNSGATSLAVFPASGDAINALAADLSVDIPVGGELTFRAIDGTTWETSEVMVLPAPTTQSGTLLVKASDNAANYAVTFTNASHGQATVHSVPDPAGATGTIVLEEITNVFDLPQRYDHNTTITAFATGGQTDATALTGEFNNVTTVATAGDSVKLPAAAAGLKVTVKNSGATSLAVFPADADSINALAINLSVNIPVGGELTFRAKDATVWETNEALVLSAPTTQSGELVIKAADNAADYEVVVVNASHGQATTHTIPDPAGAAASFVITEAAQTINGAKTFSSALKTSSGVGAVAGAGVTVVESGDGVLHQSVFTFDYTGANDFDLADGADHGTGRQFYDFPEGRVLVLGATCNLSFTATNAGNGGATYPFGIGTATAGDEGTLTGTEQDIIPSTAVAYNGGAAQALGAALAVSAQFDGTGTAKDLFFNVAVTDAVSSGAVTVAATGTLTVTWINLGDYA